MGGGTATGGGAATGGGGGAAISPTFTSLDGGPFVSELGQPFSTTFIASGTAPITFGVTAGALPAGLSLAPTTGAYEGTPTALGTFMFSVSATNLAGSTSAMVTHQVLAPPPDAWVLLTNNRLATFTTGVPASFGAPVAVTGVNINDTLVAIDHRPQNGRLYALGAATVGGNLQLYVINPFTGGASALGPAGTLVDGTGTPITFGAPTSTSYDIDFNPAADRLRIVDSNGRSLRMNPNTGSFVDGDLGGGPGTVAGLNTDGAINGGTTTASGAAYTNNQPNNGNVTTLYTLDAASSKLCLQNPPNAGTQTLCQTTAPLITGVLGFDLASGLNASSSNAAVTGLGVALVRQSGSSLESIATVNLATGGLSLAALPTTGARSLALLRSTPRALIGLSGNTLMRFSQSSPGTVTTLSMTGVTAGETMIGFDSRPATGQLMGLGVNATANTGSLYLIDPQTGSATTIGAAGSIAFVNEVGAAVDLPASGWGVDFNPTVDRMRVVTASGLNFRVNPSTGIPVDGEQGGAAGAVAGINTDGLLNGAATGLSGVSYTNGGNEPVTTEYGLDAVNNQLVIVNPPNAGTLTLPVGVTLAGTALDFTNGAFDIPSTVRVVNQSGVASGLCSAALTVGGVTSLYSIDLTTGVATSLGAIGTGATAIDDLAVGE